MLNIHLSRSEVSVGLQSPSSEVKPHSSRLLSVFDYPYFARNKPDFRTSMAGHLVIQEFNPRTLEKIAYYIQKRGGVFETNLPLI